MLASKKIRDSKTIYALKLLAESHAKRAIELGKGCGKGNLSEDLKKTSDTELGGDVVHDGDGSVSQVETSMIEGIQPESRRVPPENTASNSNRQLFPDTGII